MKDLCKMDEITQAVIESVPNKPVTVKMRAGWDDTNIVSTEAAVRLERIGVKAITLHPRTTKQQFTGRSNWKYIKEMKDAVNIPIIGNGDVITAYDYANMIEETGCDAVMIGRASLGNPWVFKSIQQHIKGEIFVPPTLEDRAVMCRKHFQLLKADKHEKLCVNLSKKHFGYYLKGFQGASCWRKKFMRSDTINEVEELLEKLSLAYTH
jgi:tRNA-dihydrouridine synthase B